MLFLFRINIGPSRNAVFLLLSQLRPHQEDHHYSRRGSLCWSVRIPVQVAHRSQTSLGVFWWRDAKRVLFYLQRGEQRIDSAARGGDHSEAEQRSQNQGRDQKQSLLLLKLLQSTIVNHCNYFLRQTNHFQCRITSIRCTICYRCLDNLVYKIYALNLSVCDPICNKPKFNRTYN